MEIKTPQIVFTAPGICSVLYTHQCELIKDLSNNMVNSTATEQEKARCHKLLTARMTAFGNTNAELCLLANTDAERCLGAGRPLGIQKVLELVIAYLFIGKDGLEVIGKEFLHASKEGSQQKVTINNNSC